MQSDLDYLLRPLTNAQHCQFTAYCAGGHYRQCHMLLSGWVADYPEHAVLQKHGYGLCHWCEVEKKELGMYIDIPVALHDNNVYQPLYKVARETLHNAEDALANLQNPDDTIGVRVHQLVESSSDINSSTPPVVEPIT
jgi:hypothetical protein